MVTIWEPRALDGDKPRYVAIADALGHDIDNGHLAPGQQLPTHRDLAETLGVTVGTVSRAYREAEGRGLVVGEVGRGTFVRRPDTPPRQRSQDDGRTEDAIDLAVNFMRMPDGEIVVPQALAQLARDPAVVLLLEEYKPQAGLLAHRVAGAKLATEAGLPAHPDEVLVCAGGQHACTVALMGLTRPGDTVVCEAWTNPTILALARTLRLSLVGLPMDDDGLDPEAFESACQRHAPRVLYCMPTLHNPTTLTMSSPRRQAIAEIAQRYGVAVVEDDVHGFLLPDAPAPLAASCGGHGFYATSCSRRMAPGLRVGYLVVPRGTQGRFLDALWSTTGMASPLMAEIASRWIHDGTAAALAEARRTEAKARRAIALDRLRGYDLQVHPGACHAWLPLPEAWHDTGSFVGRAMAAGVALTPGDAFAAAPELPSAVRLSLGAPASREILRRGLDIVADLLAGRHAMRVV